MNESFLPQINSILEELLEHIDTVVTVYTERFVHTGLLVGINEDAIKLINKSAGNAGRSAYGKVTLVRIDKIQAVTFCNTTR